MPSFEESTRTAGGRALLHRDWENWGPNGGYLSAIALRAAGAAAPADHRLVTYSCQYLSSPPSGEIEVSVTPAKVGRSAACFNVALNHDGRTALQAQVWTTNRSEGPEHQDAAFPAVPLPVALKPIEDHLPAGSPIHSFWAHFASSVRESGMSAAR